MASGYGNLRNQVEGGQRGTVLREMVGKGSFTGLGRSIMQEIPMSLEG